MYNYQAPPTTFEGTTAPRTYIQAKSEGTIGKALTKLLLTTVALTMSMPSTASQNETSSSNYVRTLANSHSSGVWESVDTNELPRLDLQELIAEKSSRLQNAFGFKTAQWAAVLGLERKTLYNWKKNPNTTVQKRTQERIVTFEAFASEIDKEHQRYISKISFGRYSEPAFREAVLSTDLDCNSLLEQYDRLYAKLDGQYKRDKHRKGLA